jgi:hypothetical protein
MAEHSPGTIVPACQIRSPERARSGATKAKTRQSTGASRSDRWPGARLRRLRLPDAPRPPTEKRLSVQVEAQSDRPPAWSDLPASAIRTPRARSSGTSGQPNCPDTTIPSSLSSTRTDRDHADTVIAGIQSRMSGWPKSRKGRARWAQPSLKVDNDADQSAFLRF